MDNTSPAASLRGPKIPKACEECRRRKQKCNGLNPCNICSKRRTSCEYRSYIRRRTGRSSTTDDHLSPALGAAGDGVDQPLRKRSRVSHDADQSGEQELSSSSSTSDPDANTFSDVPPRYHIFSSIRATHAPADSPSCVLQLYYGSSSNFSFLQHIHAHLNAQEESVPRRNAHVDEVQNGNEGIDVFKYQGLAFGSLNGPRDSNPLFLRQDLAKSFLQNYCQTAHFHIPVLPAEQLWANFERLYGSADEGTIDPAERAIVVVAMAIGASQTTHDNWRRTLLSQARSEAEAMSHIVNLRAVQIALLMAHCEFMTGNPNSSYLYLGAAIRKALASGMHRRTPTNRLPTSESNEAKKTCWSLFCYESIICLCLGRPSSFSQEDVGLAKAERPSFMALYVRLCEIIRMVQHLHNHHDSTPSRDLKAAHGIRHALKEFAVMVKEDLGFAIGGDPVVENQGRFVEQVVMSYLNYYTQVLAFRPFLLLFVELKRRADAENGGQPEPKTPFNSPPLLEACEHCVDPARKIIVFAETVFAKRGIEIEGVYNHIFFVESACFVLILAALHDQHGAGRHVRYIRRGIAALRQMIHREPLVSVIAAIETMASRVEQLRGMYQQQRTPFAAPINSIQSLLQQDATPPAPNVAPYGGSDTNGSAIRTPQSTSSPIDPTHQQLPSQHPQHQQQQQQQQQQLPVQSETDISPGFGMVDPNTPAGLTDSSGQFMDSAWPLMDWNFDLSTLDLESFVSVMGDGSRNATGFSHV
ncbi:fungal-specific transcription factor domain-containing protein [Phyllosticta citriasiana]|uniref:fungal-specific transcription factor domain-containing protein n=1 Tax=Phyllosticta citriasiana TaxID=595635 RepID=UPI0030FD9528